MDVQKGVVIVKITPLALTWVAAWDAKHPENPQRALHKDEATPPQCQEGRH